MSRDTNKSPASEVPIQEASDGGDTLGHLTFSNPISFTVVPIENDLDDKGDRDDDREKKKSRKSVDETKAKRRDTATSFSNFLHRFTRSEDKKEDKHKHTINEEEKEIGRPDKLQLLDYKERWLELRTFGSDGYRTALDTEQKDDTTIYEWKADSLKENLLTKITPAHRELLRMEQSDPQLDVMEKSLVALLDDFRSGKMRSLTDGQLAKMRAVKSEHENVTNLHLALYNLDSCSRTETEMQSDQMYDQLSHKLLRMHECMSDFLSPE